MPVVTPPTPRLALVHLPTLDDEDEYFLAQAAARDAQLHLPIHGLLFASHNLDMLQLPVTLDPALATGLCYDLRHDPHTARRANLLSGSLGLFIHNPVPTLTHPFPFASPASEPPADLLIVEMAPFGEIHIVHEPIVRCGDVLGQIHNFLWWPLHDPTTIPGAPSLRIVNAHQERTQMKPDLMRNIDALAGKTELLGFELLQDVHTGTRWSARLRQADA